MSSVRYEHISENTQICDVMAHPAFEGHGRLLFPWDEPERYSPGMTMRDVPALNIWHTNQNPSEMVAGVNRMVDDCNQGCQVFFDIYSEKEKADDPSRRDTGLFFFRGKPGNAFAVVSAGGGYCYVASLHEGFPIAMEINETGYNAFVLKYRPSHGRKAMSADLIRAVQFILSHSDELKVSKENFSLWGGSAGARLCAYVSYEGTGLFERKQMLHPAANIIAYTYLDFHPSFRIDDPSAYFITGTEDWIVPTEATRRDERALHAAGVHTEFHTPKNVGHGFGTGKGTAAEGWIKDAVRFWQDNST